MVEKETGTSRHELVKWPIIEFYDELAYQIDSAAVNKRYQEIMTKKK